MPELQDSFDQANNPLINPPALPYGAPPLNLVKTEHMMPAIKYGIARAKADIEAIKNNPEPPTFENTIEALEFAGEDLSRISSIFGLFGNSNSSDEIKALEEPVGILMSQYGSDINFDEALFARVKAVYDARAGMILSDEQKMLLENSYKGFVRSGALLGTQQKDRLRQISEELSTLTTRFQNNDTLANEAYKKVIDDVNELDGVPERAKKLYAALAEKAGMPGKYLLTLEPYPSDIMTHCTNRALREEIYRAGAGTCFHDAWDNTGIILDLVRLRDEKAHIMGFPNFAEFVLSDRMAGNAATVNEFLEKNLAVYKPAAEKELQTVKDFAAQTDGLTDLKPWDSAYYNRMLSEQTFNFKTEELRPYLDLEKVLEGLRHHAEKLFGIELREEKTGKYPVYRADVKTFEVCDGATGAIIGVFYGDYYAHPGAKVGGAHMNPLRSRGIAGGQDQIPLVLNHCNFAQPSPGQPTLLSLSDVETVFHEFGHALHGLLAQARYPSLAGPNVKWDFVELPSQVQENWVSKKEVLDTFATHYQTGQTIPAALVQKINDMQNFGAASQGLRQTNLAMLDMTYYTTDPATITSAEDLEKSVNARTSLIKREAGMMSTGFTHIFCGGYSAGYYSYKWAEALDADVFAEFEKNGLYDRATADRLRDTIYAQGGKVDPMSLFIAMMGRGPDPEAMFRRSGLQPPANDNPASAPQEQPRPGPAFGLG